MVPTEDEEIAQLIKENAGGPPSYEDHLMDEDGEPNGSEESESK